LSSFGVAVYAGAFEKALWSSDDWFHINVAQGLFALDGDAWRLPFFGDAAADALRLTPHLLFAIDWWAHGVSAQGYYTTNLLLAGTCVGCVFLLLRAFAVPHFVASLAAGCFALLSPIHQLVYWVSARDDGSALAAGLLAMVAWVYWREQPSRRWLCWCLYALACFGKPPMGIQMLLLMGLLEFLHVSEGKGGVRDSLLRLRPFVAISAVWCVLLSLLVWGRGLGTDDLGLASAGLVARRFSTLLLPTYPYGGQLGLLELLSLAVGVVGLALFAYRRSNAAGRLVMLGTGFLLAGTLPVLPWVLKAEPGAADYARYFLLPSAGVPLIGAGLFGLAPPGRLHLLTRGLGLVLVLCLALSGVSMARASLERQQSSSSDLIALLNSLHESREASSEIFVGLRQPDGGVTSFLASPLWNVVFPEFSGHKVFLQGSRRLHHPTDEAFGYGELRPSGRNIDVRALPPGALLVWQRPAGNGLSWGLAQGLPEWPESTSSVSEGLSWEEPSHRPHSERMIYREIQQVGMRLAAVTLPSRLEEACSLRLELGLPDTVGRAEMFGEESLIRGPFAIASFGPVRDAFLIPIESSTGKAEVFLPNIAGPRPRGDRLMLRGSSLAGSTSLHHLRMTGCSSP